MCTSTNGVTEADFVAMRNARDATLSVPTLLAAFNPGQHPRRRLPRRRRQRGVLSQNSGDLQGRRASRGVIAGGLRAPGSSPHPAVADQVRRLHEPGFAPCGAAARGRSVQVQSRADEARCKNALGEIAALSPRSGIVSSASRPTSLRRINKARTGRTPRRRHSAAQQQQQAQPNDEEQGIASSGSEALGPPYASRPCINLRL